MATTKKKATRRRAAATDNAPAAKAPGPTPGTPGTDMDLTPPEQPAKPAGGVELTLTGAERYSITGYHANPVLRWTQIVMNKPMADHLLKQRARSPRTRTEVPLFELGVVAPPRRKRKTEAQLMAELRNARAQDLNPNDPG